MPEFQRSKNTDYIYNILTSDKITKMSGGRIPQMTPQQAAGLIGSWIVETGSEDLSNLDVVEEVAGAGRGLSQYTGARRAAYDIERAKALRNGKDPNSVQWQLQYFVDEYTGKHDRHAGGKSLIGWTNAFGNAPKSGSAGDFAEYYTGSAASGKGYFRPGVPHLDRRRQEAERVLGMMGQGGVQGGTMPTQDQTPDPIDTMPTSNADVVTGVEDNSKPFSPGELIQNAVSGLGIKL